MSLNFWQNQKSEEHKRNSKKKNLSNPDEKRKSDVKSLKRLESLFLIYGSSD